MDNDRRQLTWAQAMIYKYLAIAAIVCGIVWAIDDFGYDRAHDKWQVKWTERELEIAMANLVNEDKIRKLQTELQSTADRVQENGNDKRNNLEVDIADGRDALGSVRDTAVEFAASAKECPSNTNAANNSKTATGTAVVLAKLLSSAEQRATELAAAYDKAKIAGDACVEHAENLRWRLMLEGE